MVVGDRQQDITKLSFSLFSSIHHELKNYASFTEISSVIFEVLRIAKIKNTVSRYDDVAIVFQSMGSKMHVIYKFETVSRTGVGGGTGAI